MNSDHRLELLLQEADPWDGIVVKWQKQVRMEDFYPHRRSRLHGTLHKLAGVCRGEIGR
jgi:hypothetical protein